MEDYGFFIWIGILVLVLGLFIGGMIGDASGRDSAAQYVCEQSGYQEGHWNGEMVVCGNSIVEFELME